MGTSSFRFVVGRAGAGKSRHVFGRVIDLCRDDPLGPAVVVLVPPQATFDTERHLTLRAADAGLGGLARVRVLDPAGLAAWVLAEAGGERRAAVDAAGRQILLAHLLRLHAEALTYFRPIATRPGTPALVDAALADLARAGTTPADAAALLGQRDDPDLRAKFADLTLLEVQYASALGDRLDPSNRFARAADAAGAAEALKGAHLFVDGFRRLDAAERRLIARVAGVAAETCVTLTATAEALEPGGTLPGDVFAPAAADAAGLRDALRAEGVAVDPSVFVEAPADVREAALDALARDFAQPRPARVVGVETSAVRLVAAADPRAEARAAAAQVKDWTLEGVRLRDCCVLFRNNEPYATLLEFAFADAGLATFMDRRRPVRHHAVARLVRSLLAVAAGGWDLEDTLALVRNPLNGLSHDGRDAAEAVARRLRVRGLAAWSTPWPADEEEPEESDAAEAARSFLAAATRPLAELDDVATLALRTSALRETLDALGVTGRVDDPETGQASANIHDLLGQASALIGGETMTAAQFASVVDVSLDRLTFAVTPATVDAVLLADVRRVVLPAGVERCVVVGLSDGVFPADRGEAALFAEGDLRQLRDAGVTFDSGDAAAADRRHAYRAFTLATRRLTLTRPCSDVSGRVLAPSPFWNRVATVLDVDPESPDAAASAGDATRRLLLWARAGGDPATPDAALYQALRESPAVVRAWASLTYANRPELTSRTLAELYPAELDLDAAEAERFQDCPFRRFARDTLRLRQVEPVEAGNADLRRVVEAALSQLAATAAAQGATWDFDPRHDAAAEAAEAVIRSGRVPRLADTGELGEFLRKRAVDATREAAARVRAILDKGRAKTIAADVRYGRSNGGRATVLPAVTLKTPAGRVVRLSGRIARVDAADDVLVAVNYGWAVGPIRQRVEVGLALRPVVDLLALIHLAKRLAGIGFEDAEPLATVQVPIGRGLRSVDKPEHEPRPGDPDFFVKGRNPRGLIARSALPLLDTKFADTGAGPATGRSGTYIAHVTLKGALVRISDVLEDDDLGDLVTATRDHIARAADGIMGGDVRVRPYRLGADTPCARCGYLAVCRFDPPDDPYRKPKPLSAGDAAGPAAEDQAS